MLVFVTAVRGRGVRRDGSQRWPAVNRLDAATLFRLSLEDAAPR